MIEISSFIKCPECGEYVSIVKRSDDFTKVTGWRDSIYINAIDIFCIKDKLIIYWKPPLWKRIFMGRFAYPKELRF